MRRRYLTVLTTLALVAVAFVLTVGSAAALPAYTTQTGQPCTACHTTATGGPLTATGNAWVAGGKVWPIPAAPSASVPAPAAPAAPAAAPTARPAAPAAGAAPSTLPTTGDAGAVSQLPMALGFLSAAFAGLGLSLRRRG